MRNCYTKKLMRCDLFLVVSLSGNSDKNKRFKTLTTEFLIPEIVV